MKKKKTWARPEREQKELEKAGTPRGGAEKFRAWGIEQTATFHHQNSNKQLLRKKKKKKKKCPEPCRFVSEGEKPAVRSNRPLIFLSCIKETILLGGYAGEQALLIFTVYLVLSSNVYIHLGGISRRIHSAGFYSPTAYGYKALALSVVLCLSEELQHPISLTRLFPAVINLQEQQPVVQNDACKTNCLSPSFFCPCRITGQPVDVPCGQ